MPTSVAVIEAARRVLEADARIAYALVFGSAAQDDGRPARDLDLAVGLTRGRRLSVRDLGELLSRLEKAAGKPVDLVLLEEAPPGEERQGDERHALLARLGKRGERHLAHVEGEVQHPPRVVVHAARFVRAERDAGRRELAGKNRPRQRRWDDR